MRWPMPDVIRRKTPENASEPKAGGLQPSVCGRSFSCDTHGLHSQACYITGNPAKDKAHSLWGHRS